MIWTLCDWKMHTWGEDEKYQLGCPLVIFLTFQKNDIFDDSSEHPNLSARSVTI